MGSNSKVIEVKENRQKIRRIFFFKENQIFCLINDDMEFSSQRSSKKWT